MESPWPEFSDKNNSFIHAGPGKLFLSFRRWMFFWKLESYSLLAPLRFPLSSVGCEHWSFQPLVAQTVRNLPVIQETQVWSLGQEDPLEKEMATHYSIIAWRIPWTEEPGGLQSTGLQRIGRNWASEHAHTLVLFNPACSLSFLSLNPAWLSRQSGCSCGVTEQTGKLELREVMWASQGPQQGPRLPWCWAETEVKYVCVHVCANPCGMS